MLLSIIISIQEHLYSTGENKYGQLGANLSIQNASVTTFQRVDLDEETKPKQISVGQKSILMVTTDGELYGWGANQYQQLSFDEKGNFTYPQLVYYFSENNITVDQVAANAYASFVLDTKGNVYSMGQKPINTCRNESSTVGIVEFNLSDDEKIIKIYGQNQLALFLTNQGNLFYCGICEFGICSGTQNRNQTSKIVLNNVIVGDVFFLPDRLILVTKKGELFGIGNNEHGQLCVGSSQQEIKSLTRINLGGTLVQAAGGYTHTLLLDAKGTVYGCGQSSMGQLGLLSEENILMPRQLAVSSYGSVRWISATYNGSILLTSKGLYIAGDDSSGELGSGSVQNISFFTQSPIEKDVKYFQFLASNVKNTFVYGIGPKVSTSMIMGYVFLALFLAIAIGIATYFLVKFIKERRKNKYKYSMAADDDEW